MFCSIQYSEKLQLEVTYNIYSSFREYEATFFW